MFSIKKTLKDLGKRRARESIQFVFYKENSERIFPGKGQGKGEYSDLFLKKKTLKTYDPGRARQGSVFSFVFSKENSENIFSGKG